MLIVLAFLAVVGAIAGWWLSTQRLMSRPWLEQGVLDERSGSEGAGLAPAKVGLGLFLAVAGSLFALVISAYSMRLQAADWWPLPVSRLLWLNTAVLIFASLALEWAKDAVRRADIAGTRHGLLAAFALSIGFLIGQVLVWRELTSQGYLLASNPANSFFYLITGLHGLHVLGGLAALGRTSMRALQASTVAQVRLGVSLCATYWHFLLFVWLVLFALLAGWAGDFLVLCRQLLS